MTTGKNLTIKDTLIYSSRKEESTSMPSVYHQGQLYIMFVH